MNDAIHLTGAGLDVPLLSHIARGAAVEVPAQAWAAVEASASAGVRLAKTRPIYGRTTGVGANHDTAVAEPHQQTLALLRSHAGGWGPTLPPPVVRAALAVRVNQLATGTSGASTALLTSLLRLLAEPDEGLPVMHSRGDLGTSDLSVLATVGLTILGERPRQDGRARVAGRLEPGDALPLMSSNAVTAARTALSAVDLAHLVRADELVTACTHRAVAASREAFDPAVLRRVSSDESAISVGESVSQLLGDAGPPAPSGRVQDFFGLRIHPQTHGHTRYRLAALTATTEHHLNTGSENPATWSVDGVDHAGHHGAFHLARLAGDLDAMLLALLASAQLSQSRTSHLLTDPSTGLPRFLAAERSGRSGLMILEYQAASALTRMRMLAASPSTAQTVHLSAGVEDHAPLTPLAVDRLEDAIACYRHLLAVEWVAAREALHLRADDLGGPIAEALDLLPSVAIGTDRDLSAEVAAAKDALHHATVLI